MPSPVPTILRPSPPARLRLALIGAAAVAGTAGLALAARGLFAHYATPEWHLAVVRTLSGLGVVVPLLLISYLTLRAAMARAENAKRHLTEVNQVYLSTVETLAAAIDSKDQVRSHDLRRLQDCATRVARAVGIEGEPELRAIEAAVLLHDMGKVSVPAAILNKPGTLTPAEFDRVKQHVTVAAQILQQIDFPYPVVPVVRHHHEHWDGSGYPDGLRGEAIPLGARVMAVVDCYDALTSHRPYRPALSSEEALRIIVERRGSVYDPRVVDAFVDVIERFAFPVQTAVAVRSVMADWFAAPASAEGEAPAKPATATGGCRR